MNGADQLFFENWLDGMTTNAARETLRADGWGKASKCAPNNVDCVLDALFPNKNRENGDPVTCKDVERFFAAVDEKQNQIQQLRAAGIDKPRDLLGKNAGALFPNGETFETLQPCETACETNNFQNCRVVTPNNETGARLNATILGRPGRFTSEVAGVLSSDVAAAQDDLQQQRGAFVRSSSSFDTKKYQKKRAPMFDQTSLGIAAAFVAGAFFLKNRR